MKTQNLTLDASAKGTIEGVTGIFNIISYLWPCFTVSKELSF